MSIINNVIKDDFQINKTNYIHKINMKNDPSPKQLDGIKSKCGNIKTILQKISNAKLTQKEIQYEEDNIKNISI
jgi:hypothetical protein